MREYIREFINLYEMRYTVLQPEGMPRPCRIKKLVTNHLPVYIRCVNLLRTNKNDPFFQLRERSVIMTRGGGGGIVPSKHGERLLVTQCE